MNYVFTYHSIVNREYNIYKEIKFNPFLFSYIDTYNPMDIKDINRFSKSKQINILNNLVDDVELDIMDFLVIYKILMENGFFKTESFNLYSNYVDELLFSDKVEEVTIIIQEIDKKAIDHVKNNITRRFGNHHKLKLVVSENGNIVEDLKETTWNAVSIRDLDQAMSIINSDINIKDKDIILDELQFNILDATHYIILQEKEGRIDYRTMI